MSDSLSEGLTVLESRTEGLGLFAARNYAAGDVLLLIDDTRAVDKAHPLTSDDDARHCDYLADGRVVLMQHPERHINHSCDPNVYVLTKDGTRQVLAIRDIEAGEEIAYDYSINSGGHTVWICHCGAARCRKNVHSDFFHLPTEIQFEYLRLLDEWFREERREEVERLEMLAREKALSTGEG